MKTNQGMNERLKENQNPSWPEKPSEPHLKEALEEALLEKQLKQSENIELPMDEAFFDRLHDQIMAEVEKTEIKPTTRWSKTREFLERAVTHYRPSHYPRAAKSVKLALTGVVLTLGLGLELASFSIMSSTQKLQQQKQAELVQLEKQAQLVAEQALEKPEEWVEMAVQGSNAQDFYADVLAEKLTSEQLKDLKL